MNSAAHISTKNRDEAKSKIQAKLDAVRSYGQGGKPSFELPSKFTLNWFASLEDENTNFHRVSKGSALLKTGSSMHAKVTAALTVAQSRLEDSQKVGRVTIGSAIRNEVKRLKAENAELKHRMKGLVKNTVDLLKELDHYKTQLGLEQAAWQDSKKKGASKT